MAFQRFRRNYQPRSGIRQVFDWAFTIVVFALIVLTVVRLDDLSAKRAAGVPVVVDGDSLVLKATKIRLQGIDAPEFSQTCKRAAGTYPCGREARAHLERLVAKRPADCKGWQNDKYGRLLATCNVALRELNSEMVLAGWAVSYGDYFAEETSARLAKRGVWQGDFERPSTWRKMRGDMVDVPHDWWFKVATFFKSLFTF